MKSKNRGIPMLNIDDTVIFTCKIRLSDGTTINKGQRGVIIDRNDPSGIYTYAVSTLNHGIIIAKDWNIELV